MLEKDDQIGDYTLIRFLGKGQFGEVWLAEKKVQFSNRKFRHALKFLSNSDEEINLGAVETEIDTWIEASGHPNVMPVTDMLVHGRYVIIVSEYADGGSLKDWLKEQGGKAASYNKALEMAIGVLRGLEHLHSRNVVHRDLKPDNILLQGDSPRITDFGISRVVSENATATNAGGSPIYMSPEAYLGSKSPQTDIWSAGVILFEMLTGRYPFEGESIYEVRDSVHKNEPRDLPGDVPAEIQALVYKALQKNQADRFQSAKEMRIAAEKASHKLGVSHTAESAIISKYLRELTETVPFDDAAETIKIESGVDGALETQPSKPADSNDAGARHTVETPGKGIVQRRGLVLPIAIVVLLGFSIFLGVEYYRTNFGSSEAGRGPTVGTITPTPNVSEPTSITAELVPIPGGTFKMGSPQAKGLDNERPEHAVDIKPFKMDKTEVTNAEYYAFVTETSYRPVPASWVRNKPASGEERMPVRFVNIEDINAFIAWRSERDKTAYHLPTEAEWEFAARNGEKDNLYPWGDTFQAKCAVTDKDNTEPEPVNSMSCPNDWGVVDLIGNVYEWTGTIASLYPGSKGTIKETKEPHYMIRGGGAITRSNGNFGITATSRADVEALKRDKELGFRLVAAP